MFLQGEEELRILDTITYQDVEYTVTAVGEYAFQYNKAKVITLPDTITRIEAYAFDHCEKAESINIPSSVTYIGRAAFNTCTALEGDCHS
ncbi:MAG: leucine-rich repeat domain-containing protein [Clostridia bacterium]